MKALLLQPHTLEKLDILSVEMYPPLGIISLAAVLRKKGHQVSVFDAKPITSSLEEVIGVVKDFSPDVVGITSTTSIIFHAFDVARAIKTYKKSIYTIIGGVHATVDPEHALSDPSVDFIVRGEGEVTLCELLEALEGNKEFSEVPGIGFRKGGEIILTPPRVPISDIDSLPIPAYELLPIHKYRSAYASRLPFMNMVRSRGCPHRCIFCAVPNVFGHAYRCQSPQRSIEEIEYLVKTLGIREILFKDSELTMNNKNLEELCEFLIKKNFDLIWCGNGRVDHVNRNILKKMKEAGCVSITYGIESGDQEILDRIKKKITLEQARQAIRMTKEVGLRTVTNFMLGHPGETRETIEKTISFAKELNTDYGYFVFITPFPGTELRQQALENDWLLDKRMEAIVADRCIMNATAMSTAELKGYLKKIYLSFYFRPSYILNRLTKLRWNDLRNNYTGLRSIVKYFLRGRKNR